MLRKLSLITLCASLMASNQAEAKTIMPINGIIAGSVAYWLTKIACYSAVSATAALGTAAAVAAAGPAGPAVAIATANVALPGAGVAAGAAGVIGTGIAATPAIASTVAAGTVAATAHAGGVVGLVGTIESASTTMGYIFTVCPWLP